ncbi:uncharacterized protein N7482_009384 [Penicillium canariense]|uniref:Nucleoporin NUP37 n=1 Tax=Penicillium canariense TaxID=189055 RepID=A0A9W9HNR6_9EURO|nr:uncharacterized protein N7482_009384 [Penicillium canariense]KAJ5152906.1 hypothetical protein N7482_009384 [Penicillium canariense]
MRFREIFSYRLPHRIHAAQAYPLRSPNGSSIIIYGYETGLKVVWRGGREFSELKEAAPSTQVKSANNGDDAVMIIDSDEEDTSAAPAVQEEPSFEFATEETEVDPAFPYEPILRQIDIPLESRVLGVAVPRVVPDEVRSSLDPFPSVAKHTIVVAAVCSDLSTRVITLPLLPPHPAQKDPRSWNIQKVTINGGVTHQDIPRGVSLTFTFQESEDEQDRRKSRSGQTGGSGKWDLLVATHSAEGSGALLIHRIPLREETFGKDVLYRLVEEDLVSQRRALPSPAQTIAFNPSPYPSARHSSLLVAFHSGCAKVYSCCSIQRTSSKGSRRGSIPQEEYGTIDTEGRWLISLYPGFEQNPNGLTRRKTIIDADWVLGGRAVMVLLADGEWGVWDIEGAGPGTTKGPLHRQSNVQGVTGGSLTTYAVSGRIVAPLTNTQSEAEQRSRFAPMTPSTRRVREDTLLKGSMTAASPSLRGQISVSQTNVSHDLPDESILMRHGQHSAVIPSLLSLWRNAVRATGTFDASNRCRVTPFQVVNLMGENFQAISHLPAPLRQSRTAQPQTFDILVAAEHQIVILAPQLVESDDNAAAAQVVKQEVEAEADQMMLRRGELDVEGMGRLLNGMAGGSGSLRVGGSPVKRARIFT